MLATLKNEPDSQEQTINQSGEGENWGNRDVDRAGRREWVKKKVFTLLMRRRGTLASGS